VVEAPPYVLDLESATVTRFGEAVPLTDKEFQLATYLFRNAGRLLSRAHLLSEVWGVRSQLTTRTVDTHMSKLRRKLGLSADVGWRLRAVYQHGYRLERLTVP
jgi:DNA-binding response OmpR family regulator